MLNPWTVLDASAPPVPNPWSYVLETAPPASHREPPAVYREPSKPPCVVAHRRPRRVVRKDTHSTDLFVNIVVAGMDCVGKTSLINRFIDPAATNMVTIALPQYDEFTTPIEVYDVDRMDVTEINIRVFDWDWVDPRRVRFSDDLSKLSGFVDSCILVYDVTDRRTFDALDALRADFLSKVVPPPKPADAARKLLPFPFVVVGNKIDSGPRVVPFSVAEKWAHKWEYVYFETSAAAGALSTPIEVVFAEAANLGQAYHNAHHKPSW